MANLADIDITTGEATTRPYRRGPDPDRDIAVLMSGGVDSSVAASLLCEAGWNVVGITLQLPVAAKADRDGLCAGNEAAAVARNLDIAHYYLDVRDVFERLVIEPFRRAYEQGRTPSPCVDCNTLFKFGAVWEAIKTQLGVSNLATGHYARVIREAGDDFLVRGDDRSRDQSYFLYGIPRHRLAYLHLPLGDLTKDEVRRVAKESALPAAHREDSMELCFAAGSDYRAALGLPAEKGSILDIDGKVIGEHNGIANYTTGQRKGVGVAAGKPIYVISIDPVANTITVGSREQALKCHVDAQNTNILIPEQMTAGAELFGKIRSQGEPAACVLTEVGESTMTVRFVEEQFAPTAGQRLVLYDSNSRVVAGGVICSGCDCNH